MRVSLPSSFDEWPYEATRCGAGDAKQTALSRFIWRTVDKIFIIFSSHWRMPLSERRIPLEPAKAGPTFFLPVSLTRPAGSVSKPACSADLPGQGLPASGERSLERALSPRKFKYLQLQGVPCVNEHLLTHWESGVVRMKCTARTVLYETRSK